MKHILKIHSFSFKKIVDGSKTIDIRLFNEQHQLIRPNDIIEFVCDELKERVLCLVKAFLVFDNAETMIDVLPPYLFGYPNREEIKVRARRLFTLEEQLKYNVMGIIIECLDKKGTYNTRDANSLDDEDELRPAATLTEPRYRPVSRESNQPSPAKQELNTLKKLSKLNQYIEKEISEEESR